MKRKPGFEIVKIADDFTLVPLGENIESFNGTVILNHVSAFMLECLSTEMTVEELIHCVMKEYNIDNSTASKDTAKALEEMKRIGIIDA